VLRALGPTVALPGDSIKAFYNDEHALLLGVSQIQVVGGGTTNYPVSPLATDPGGTAFPNTGSNIMSGPQAAIDPSARPLWPSMFITDITNNPSNTTGDWQNNGALTGPAVNIPTGVFGTWKAATIVYNAGARTVSTGTDPASNGWNLDGGDTPPGGLTNQGFGAEVRWDTDALISSGVFQTGHTYRIQIMVHDGDQNQSGGDVAEACSTIFVPGTTTFSSTTTSLRTLTTFTTAFTTITTTAATTLNQFGTTSTSTLTSTLTTTATTTTVTSAITSVTGTNTQLLVPTNWVLSADAIGSGHPVVKPAGSDHVSWMYQGSTCPASSNGGAGNNCLYQGGNAITANQNKEEMFYSDHTYSVPLTANGWSYKVDISGNTYATGSWNVTLGWGLVTDCNGGTSCGVFSGNFHTIGSQTFGASSTLLSGTIPGGAVTPSGAYYIIFVVFSPNTAGTANVGPVGATTNDNLSTINNPQLNSLGVLPFAIITAEALRRRRVSRRKQKRFSGNSTRRTTPLPPTAALVPTSNKESSSP
jgi:hypothetical protein